MNKQQSSIGRQISIIYRYGQSYLSKKLEPYGIGSGQYVFLLTLNRKDGISQEELSAYLRIDKATTAKSIKKLMADGYIRRDVDSGDKRAYKVFLTEKARTVIPVLKAAIKGWEDMLTTEFSIEEKRLIEQFLAKMALNVHQMKAN